MAKRDYYETLGVGKGASAADIKKAYRKLAGRASCRRLPGRLAFGISVEIGKLSCGARPQLMSKIDCNF